jgi:hypothetical protein
MKPPGFDIDSATFNRECKPMPAPAETGFPDRAQYVGCPQSSDRETVLAPMSAPKQAVPGSAMPGVPWRSVDTAVRKRGTLGT